jgi:hypothetical protein
MSRQARNAGAPEAGSSPAVVKIGEEFFGCSIKNMSLTGAGLRFKTAMELPAYFELRFGRVKRNCSLVWQENETAEVLFVAGPEP